VCQTESALCGMCEKCVKLETVVCPAGWFSSHGKCYMVYQDEYDYGTARELCRAHGADLVSINSEEENDFVWKICGTGADNPIVHPRAMKLGSCWLGIEEKPLTGNKDTLPRDQEWQWVDGSTPSGYSNWRQREREGIQHHEPNNGRRKEQVGEVSDERHAAMNQPRTNDFGGKWYDKPASFKALPVCEVAAHIAAAIVSHDQHARKLDVLSMSVARGRPLLRGRKSKAIGEAAVGVALMSLPKWE